MKGDWCVQVVDPQGNIMYLRRGPVAGEGPLVCFGSPKDAKDEISFIKEGMTPGEDYDTVSVVRWESIPKEERT